MYGNGSALVPSNGRMSRQAAMLNRIEFVNEADLRVKQQADQDELQAAKLAAKATEANRALEKYQAGLIAISELLRRLDSEDMTAAQVAITEQMMREHQAVMVTAITEFCGGNVDASKIVANDVDKLRQAMQGSSGRRGRVSRKPHADFDVQED